MALDLNPPSVFNRPPTKGNSTKMPVLLPPSSFKMPSEQSVQRRTRDLSSQRQQLKDTNEPVQSKDTSSTPDDAASLEEDPWKSLALATRKLEELKEQNAGLMRSQQRKLTVPVTEEIKARVDIHQPSPHHQVSDHAQYLHLRHTADILTRQATEVAQLKTELDGTRSSSAREVAELRERLRRVEAEKMEGMAELTARLRAEEERHRKQLDDLKTVHGRENTTLQHKLTDLEGSLQRSEATNRSTVAELQNNLAAEKTQHTQDVACLREELRCKQEETVSLSSLVAQLRTYIGESRQEAQSVSKWQQHKLLMDKRINELDKECEGLQSTIQLLNIRLSSTNEILTIQESEVAKVKLEGIDGSKMAHGLLTRWREKVFALMVQQKSQDIVLQKDAKEQQNKITDLENKVASTQNQCLMLEHSIADRDAQLQMERGKIQSLEEELETLRQVTDAMDAQLQDDEEAVMGLNTVCNGDWYHSYEERMQTVTTKLGAFEQRVHFATSRVDVLKGLFARKEALLKIHLSQEKSTGTLDEPPSTAAQETPSPVNERIAYDELVIELERVRKERGGLAEKIKEDATFFEETMQTTRQKLESKIAEEEDKSRTLENLIEEKNLQIQSLGSEMDEKQASLSEATDTISKLKVDIAKLQVGADRASKSRCESMEHQYKSQLLEMEQRLNEARREHAKAVVSLRQLERQNAREKERAAQTLQLQEEQSQLEVKRLANQLRDIEKDKNLLMATLRQEGLISQYKAQRAAAKQMPPDKDSQPISAQQVTPSSQSISEQPAAMTRTSIQQQKGSLSTMLADIRTLSEQVLQDEEEEDDKDPGS